MFKLIYSNLRLRPTRTAVSVLAVSLGVALVLVSVGLSHGQLTDLAFRTRQIGGDFILQSSEGSYFFALDSGALPTKLNGAIEKVKGIEAATPILVKFSASDVSQVYGIDQQSFQRVNTSLKFAKGRMFQEPYEIVVDTIYSNARKLEVGDELQLLGHSFRISGLYYSGTGARKLIPLSTLQSLNGTPSKASLFFIRAEEGTSEDEVYQRLKEHFKGYKITKTSELLEIFKSNTPVLKPFLVSVVWISIVVSFLIVLLSMYSTITERTREIGILKSLGASTAYIIKLILKESLLITGLGAGFGFLVTFVAIKLVLAAFPTLPVTISGQWYIVAPIIAIAGGVLGALYPAYKAATLNPVTALSYE